MKARLLKNSLAAGARKVPSNEEKLAVWAAYHAKKPTRVPLRWNVNPRVLLLDPSLNPEGVTFEQYFNDPPTTLAIQTRFQEYCAEFFSRTSDVVDTLPEVCWCHADIQNCADPMFFGGSITYAEGQVPGIEPFMSIDDVDDFLARDFTSDLANNPLIRRQRLYCEQLEKAAKDFTHLGRRIGIWQYISGFDGPLTTCMSMFGPDILLLIAEEPEKAKRLFAKMARDLSARNRYLRLQAGLPATTEEMWWADDSIQLISTDTYRDLLLDSHKTFVESMTGANPVTQVVCHLCGDATRHFKTILDTIRITHFDTGFPVNFGALRRELGPEVAISGGPPVALIQNGTAQQCYDEARRILASGVCEGGRFILQEANNLPPCCPFENLQAIYSACLEFGNYK